MPARSEPASASVIATAAMRRPATIGVIGWLGEPVSALRGRELCRWRSTCAMIFQQFNLLPRIDWLSGMVRRHFIGKRTL
jgi:ABC-type phosphate/phosphonate transport system ATPase subunit